MNRLLGLSTLLLVMSGFSLAQSAIGAGTPDLLSVVSQCVAAATAPADIDPKPPSCVQVVQDYLDALASNPDSSDQDVADLVIAIAQAAQQDTGCNATDEQAGQAIMLASLYSTSGAQASQLVLISQAASNCTLDEFSLLPLKVTPSPAG